MRLKLAAIVMVVLPAVVVAQSSVPAPGVSAALPPIGLPLPPIGLPLPPIGLPPAIDAQPGIRGAHPRGTENQQRRFGRKHNLRSDRTVIFFVPAYGWGYPNAAQTATPTSAEPREQKPLTGSLRLDVQPGGVVQLYVDGYYVGTADDFNGELELEAGLHKIEIRATGYETLDLDVNIAPHRSITYRGALKAAAAPPTPDPPVHTSTEVTPATPTTFYLIPGCYLGNVPPKDAGLPTTCDDSRVITFRQ